VLPKTIMLSHPSSPSTTKSILFLVSETPFLAQARGEEYEVRCTSCNFVVSSCDAMYATVLHIFELLFEGLNLLPEDNSYVRRLFLGEDFCPHEERAYCMVWPAIPGRDVGKNEFVSGITTSCAECFWSRYFEWPWCLAFSVGDGLYFIRCSRSITSTHSLVGATHFSLLGFFSSLQEGVDVCTSLCLDCEIYLEDSPEDSAFNVIMHIINRLSDRQTNLLAK
jgi:hypothetical protein